jgi:hypothetical protein
VAILEAVLPTSSARIASLTFSCDKMMSALETALQVLGQLGQRVLVGQIGAAAQRRQRRQAVQRARVQVMEAELSATRWRPCPCRMR